MASYFGTRRNSNEEHPPGTPITVSHLTPLCVRTNPHDYFPVCIPELVSDLKKLIEDLAVRLETEQRAGTAVTLLTNMNAAAAFIANPKQGNYTW